MFFLFEETKDGMRILRAFGKSEIIEIPEKIENVFVTELGAYAFSDKIDRVELEKLLKNGKFCDENGRIVSIITDFAEIEGSKVREIYFPLEMKKIGRYAFYNCGNLCKLSFYGKLTDIGAGAFTGCHKIREFSVYVEEDGNSCLRELLTELPEKQSVDYYRNGEHGRFLFPEFFEEGVENTPARILENHIHGSGFRYRNAFHYKNLNIKEYDEMLEYAIAWESEQIVAELSLGRILFPLELSDFARERYLAYLKEHWNVTVKILLEQKEYNGLKAIIEEIHPSEEVMSQMLYLAEKSMDSQAVSICMDYHHRYGKKKRKVFEF